VSLLALEHASDIFEMLVYILYTLLVADNNDNVLQEDQGNPAPYCSSKNTRYMSLRPRNHDQ
jgi:hypothetical protein